MSEVEDFVEDFVELRKLLTKGFDDFQNVLAILHWFYGDKVDHSKLTRKHGIYFYDGMNLEEESMNFYDCNV
jgi:hypothetical protein